MPDSLPLVLLHGWGFDSRIWEKVLPELGKSFNVRTIDLPGFGSHTFCSEDIDAVARYVTKQLPDKSILLGWSLGGMVATYIAIHYPQRVSGLITIGSNLKWVSDASSGNQVWPGASPDNFAAFFENLAQNFDVSKQYFCGVIARGDKQEKMLVKYLRSHLAEVPQQNFIAALRLLDTIDNRQGFQRLAVPGLHLFGEHDVLVPLLVEASVHQLNRSQQTMILPGLAHAPFLSEPDAFVSIVKNFSQQLRYRLEKKQIANSFSKAAATYDNAAQLQHHIGNQLFSALLPGAPPIVLDLGCGTGAYGSRLQQKFPQAQVISLDLAIGMLERTRQKQKGVIAVCADAERLPIRDAAVNVIFSNLAIQWCQDHQLLFSELFRVLAPGGQCVISTFLEGTLKELKAAWREVDEATHVNQFAYSDSLREFAFNAGFCSIDVQHQSIVQHYVTVKELAMELKAIGAHNLNDGRPDGLTGKNKLKKLLDAYELFRVENRIPATYEIVFLVLKKE